MIFPGLRVAPWNEQVTFERIRETGLTFPFISVRAFTASSSDANVTNPKPFDLSETLSVMIVAGRGENVNSWFQEQYSVDSRKQCHYHHLQ